MKVVLNKCYGGFKLSKEVCEMLGCDKYDYSDPEIEYRNDYNLVRAIETLGEKANTHCSKLKVVEIPDTFTDSLILDYDGIETLYLVCAGKIERF